MFYFGVMSFSSEDDFFSVTLLANRTGLTPATVEYGLIRLEDDGWVQANDVVVREDPQEIITLYYVTPEGKADMGEVLGGNVWEKSTI